MNCASNIITANFSGGKTHATTARVYQWSRGIELCITGADNLPQTFKAHFSVQKKGGVATTIVGIDERVDVPNVLFTIGKDIHVWLGASETEDDAEILYTVDIPVAPAPMPEYYDAEDTGVFDAVVEQVSSYAATATAAANSAGASATAAAGSASSAAASASSAAGSAGAAEQARADAVTAKGQAETAAQTATEKALQTAQNASQAALDAGRAESAAERAESAETGAGTAKTAAEAAAQSAAASAATADEKATLAGQSATAAAGSASAAAQSAASIEGDVQIASQKASEAQTAAGQAVTAKDAAVTAQQGAETAATNAGQSASTATAKAAEAATSASNAAASKSAAEAAATRAEQAAASLTVDNALSDTSENPVQNKVITGELTDVKSALENAQVFTKNNLYTTDWKQGWWGASSGAYDANHTNAICTRDYINKRFLSIVASTGYKFRLQAWEAGTYQGIWNGTTFVKSNPNYFMTSLYFKSFVDDYPTFDFKIVAYVSDGTTDVTVEQSINIYFVTPTIEKLLPLETLTDHVNIFDFADTFYFENRSGTEKYASSYTVDAQNETITANTPYTTGARYIVVENKTLDPGDYILSCYVSGVTHASSVGEILVNIGEQPESTLPRYKLNQGRNTQKDVDSNVSEGWVYFKKTITSPTKFRFCVQPIGQPTDQMVISSIMITKNKTLTEYKDYEESFSGVDKYARSVIDNIIKPKVYSYKNPGEKIHLKSQMFDVESMPYSLPSAGSYGKSSKQDFDIYNGILFQLLSDNYVVLVDLQSGEVVGNYAIMCGHGNSCQFATELENENDEFPPLYCFNYYVNRVYKNKVTLSGATLEATYILDGVEGERFSGGYDSINNMLISISYAVDSSTTPTDNKMTFAVWNLNNLTDLGDGTYTPELVRKVTMPFIPVVQGCKAFNNRLYALTGYYPTYKYPVKLYAFDYYGICTNIIDTFPSNIRTSEGEGIAFPKTDEGYECYLSTYNFYKLLFD